MASTIPKCPLIECRQRYLLFYANRKIAPGIESIETCAVYILAHNAALDIKDKQNNKK